jgi:hypothetical protein
MWLEFLIQRIPPRILTANGYGMTTTPIRLFATHSIFTTMPTKYQWALEPTGLHDTPGRSSTNASSPAAAGRAYHLLPARPYAGHPSCMGRARKRGYWGRRGGSSPGSVLMQPRRGGSPAWRSGVSAKTITRPVLAASRADAARFTGARRARLAPAVRRPRGVLQCVAETPHLSNRLSRLRPLTAAVRAPLANGLCVRGCLAKRFMGRELIVSPALTG